MVVADRIALMNTVKKMIISFANTNGVLLQEYFDDSAELDAFVVALTFKELLGAGLPVEVAFDTVCGDNAYNTLLERLLADAQVARQRGDVE
jgi:hypothetical protein